MLYAKADNPNLDLVLVAYAVMCKKEPAAQNDILA